METETNSGKVASTQEKKLSNEKPQWEPDAKERVRGFCFTVRSRGSVQTEHVVGRHRPKAKVVSRSLQSVWTAERRERRYGNR